jgi:CRP-like cAMP-binding protein
MTAAVHLLVDPPPPEASLAELARIETVVFLQSADLFAYCSAEQTLRIAMIAHERLFKPGQQLYRRNDPADTLYCLVRGEIGLEDAQGEVNRVGPLTTFGVVELLSGYLRTCTATAESESLVLAIGAEDFFDLLASNIEIVKALFRQLLREGHFRAC